MGNLTHTISGGVANFKSAARAPIESLKCYFEPVQEGSGDPSPENVRPITGWDGITAYKAQKNIGHIIGFSAAANTVQNRVYTNNYGTTIDTINFNGPNGTVVITQSQAPESSSIANYKNGYITFYPDNLAFNQKYNISFKVSNIITNPLNATINNFCIMNPFGSQNYPTRVQDNILYYDNFTYKKREDRPEITCIDIRICGMSCTISDFMITPVSIENDGIWEPYISKNIVKWNQWFKPLTAENWQPYSTSNISAEFENGIATSTWLTNNGGYSCAIRTKVGILQSNKEKWYLSYMIKASMAGGTWGAEYNGGLQQSFIVNEEADTWYQCSLSGLYWKGTRNYAYISYYRNGIAEHTGMVAQIKAPIFVNLTQMFGAGNEPTKEEFEAQCALNGIDLTKELPYDEGSTIEWKTNGDLLKQEITFPVLGKNKFNINSTYAEPSNTAYSVDTGRIFQPYTYCVGLTNGNSYSPERITEYSISNNTLTFTSSNTSFGIAFFIPLLYGTYRLSYTGENVNATIIRYDENNNFTYKGSAMDAQGIFNVVKEVKTFGILFRATTANTPATVSNIQVEEGITVTEYEEFNPNHTVYGGYVDFAKGELVVEKVKHIITSDGFQIANQPASTGGIYFYKNITLNTSTTPEQWAANKSNELYSHGSASNPYGNKSKNSGWIYKSSATGSTLRLGFTDEMNITTVEELYNWINNNDEISIVYPLKSPIHYPLTPSQITTFLNYNNFWSNANGQTEVTYAIHDAAPIRAAKHRIAANEPHIETMSGSIATFKTDMAIPLKSLVVNIPVTQSGTGDPSPDNVRPISGITATNIMHYSENLLPLTLPNDAFAGTFGTKSTSIASAANARCWCIYIGKNKSIYYQRGSGTPQVLLAFSDTYLTNRTGAVIFDALNMTNRNNTSMNSGEHPYLIINVPKNTVFNPDTGMLDANSVMLSFGSTRKTYAKRTDSVKLPITFTDPSTGDPLTVYGGYVDLTSGELVSEWRKINVADLTWNNYSGKIHYYAYIPSAYPRKAKTLIYSDQLTPRADGAFTKEVVGELTYYGPPSTEPYATNYKDYIWTKLPETMEYADANNWIKTNYSDAYIIYKLITPIHYQLTPQQIKTLCGSNNIWSDAGNTTVKYWTH